MDSAVRCDVCGMCGAMSMLMSAVIGLTGRRLECVVSRNAIAIAGYVVYVTSVFFVAYGMNVLAVNSIACVIRCGVR